MDEGVDGEGDVVLALELLAVLAQEVDEEGLALGEVVGCEAEEVHADGGVGGQGVHAAVGVLVLDAVGGAADAGALGHADEQAVGVGFADAAADGAVLAERVLEAVAHHAVASCGAVEGLEVARHDLEGVAAVEVVGVDDGEGLMDGVLGHEDGVVGAPGLLASFGDGEAGRQLVEFLEDILHGDAVAVVVGIDVLLELLGEGAADDEDHFAEAGADGVVDAVVEDGLAVRAYAVHLLQSAVAAAHAGSQNK